MEKYLLSQMEWKIKSRLTQLRISSHSLYIEAGCYNRPKLSREKRFCFSCKDVIEDEKHFLFYCKLYDGTKFNNRINTNNG